jgi:uncharacterized RDD family membrane protein YckC
MDTTYSVPPPGAAPYSPARPSAPPPPQPPDRKELDSRRVLARLIDLFVVGAPGVVVATGASRSLSTLLMSLVLGYFFLCEGLWGQTIGKRVMGLRVLMRDGRAATASAVSARTVLRLIEDNPIGLIAMVLSGRRRQRIGDLLGGTIVARATPGLPHAELSPMHLVYPVAWTIGAIAFALYTQPQQDYLARVDSVCAHRQQVIASTPPTGLTIEHVQGWLRADHQVLVAMPAPAGSKDLRAEIIRLDASFSGTLDASLTRANSAADPRAAMLREWPVIEQHRREVAARFAQLGLPHCAGVPA